MRVGVGGSLLGSATGSVLDERIADRLSEPVTLLLPAVMQYINHVITSQQLLIKLFQSVKTFKNEIPWLCSALFPDPSEVQLLVLCNSISSSFPTLTPFQHHFVITH